MSTVVITIKTDNAAFQDNPNELPRILRNLADQFENSLGADDPRDSNGNLVGTVEVKGGE